MKQLFHAIVLQKYGASTQAERLQAEAARLYAERKLAENIVDQTERDGDGNLYLGGTPVRPEDALYFSLEDIRYFQKTDQHLTPTQLIAIKNDDKTEGKDVSILYPEEAYKVIQEGKYNAQFKQAKISQYYTWGDVFKGTSGYPVTP